MLLASGQDFIEPFQKNLQSPAPHGWQAISRGTSTPASINAGNAGGQHNLPHRSLRDPAHLCFGLCRLMGDRPPMSGDVCKLGPVWRGTEWLHTIARIPRGRGLYCHHDGLVDPPELQQYTLPHLLLGSSHIQRKTISWQALPGRTLPRYQMTSHLVPDRFLIGLVFRGCTVPHSDARTDRRIRLPKTPPVPE